MKRVLHIVGKMDRAGAETMIMNLYRAIDRSRYQFDFVYFTTESCDYDAEITDLGGKIIRIPSKSIYKRVFLLFKLFRARKWDIVHVHTLFSGAFFLFAAFMANVRVRVAHSHSTSDVMAGTYIHRIYSNMSRWLYRKTANKFVACGNEAAAYLFPKVSKVVILPNAIDAKLFIEADGKHVRQEVIKSSQDDLILLHLARFTKVKNHDFTIRLARHFRQVGAKFKILLVGDGPLLAKTQNDVAKEGLAGSVIFLGLRDDIPCILQASDIMIMPSLYEGIPVSLIEAQAAGIPSIISDTISKEVDLELGLVSYLSLSSPLTHWEHEIKKIMTKCSIEMPSPKKREEALSSKGFSTSHAVHTLIKVYSNTV